MLTGQTVLVAKYVMQRKCSSNTHLPFLFVSYATEMQLIEHDIIKQNTEVNLVAQILM